MSAASSVANSATNTTTHSAISPANNPEASVDRIPAEFGYWQNMQKPFAKRLRSAMKLVFRFDPVLPEDKVRAFAHGCYDTDPLAEAVVADLMHGPGGIGKVLRAVDQGMEEGIDSLDNPPDSLVALINEINQFPSWVDLRQVERGARAFRRYGRQMFYYAGSVTLEGYRESSVAKPLAFTGAYGGESSYRRFLETCNFWHQIAQPEALLAGGQGRKTAVKVRMMHVLVRARLMKHPKWDADAWGMPINQSDSLVTLMAGSVGAGIGSRKMGFRYSKRDIEDMLHFWRYVGYLMGVQPRWYPQTVKEGVQLAFTTVIKGVKKSGEDGTDLSRSYLQAFAPNENDPALIQFRDFLNYNMQVGFTRYLLTKETYEHYDLPKNGPWQWVMPLAQAPMYFALETIRKPIKPLDRWLDKWVQKDTRRWLARELGEKGAAYQPVAKFTR